MLPETERAALEEHWPGHEVLQDGAGIAVVLHDFELPEGFVPRVVDVLLRLPFGFPDSPPDMLWINPTVTLHGKPPEATQLSEVHFGRSWQRFSRHLPQGAWRAGIDGVRSYIALISTQLGREAAVGSVAA
jgi:hypothetical protein